MASHFNEVNDIYQCVELLEEVNNLIHTLFKLSDTQYYLDYIFNSSTDRTKALAEMGVDSDYLSDLAGKFEAIRSIVFGESVDWEGLVRDELKEIAKSQHDELKINDDTFKKMRYDYEKLNLENKRLTKQLEGK